MDLSTLKFFKLLQTFSPEELKQFGIWLQSPWSNTNKNLIKLLEKTKKYHPDYSHNLLTKERLFRRISPKGKYSENRMINILSKGYLAAERFMVFQAFDKQNNLQQDVLTKELQRRHLEDWFFKSINQEINQLDNKEIKDWEDHLDLYRFHRRIYHHPNENPRMQNGTSTISKMSDEIDLIYLLEKATIINEQIFRNRILKNENHEVSLELKKWFAAAKGVSHISIEFYKKRFEYTEQNMLEKYFELRTAFFQRFEELNIKEQKVHLISLLNDTTLLIKSKHLEITEGLPLYKLGLETGILLHNRMLLLNMYVTIVSASNTKKDFTYTTDFIRDYTNKLQESF